jgi:hypothetical protein
MPDKGQFDILIIGSGEAGKVSGLDNGERRPAHCRAATLSSIHGDNCVAQQGHCWAGLF